jgi:hypothetical protein
VFADIAGHAVVIYSEEYAMQTCFAVENNRKGLALLVGEFASVISHHIIPDCT